MRWRKAARFFFIFLGSIFGIIALLFIVLNLPFLEGFVTRQSNQILSKADIPIHIDAIKRVMPYSVKIQGILITDLKSDTIIHVGELKTNCKLRALARKKVVLKDLDIDQASVDLLMDYETRKLNIAQAFTGGREPEVDPAEKKKAAWVISVKKGKLISTHFRMIDSISGIHILQDISGVKLKSFSVSLRDREILANTLELENVEGNIRLGSGKEPADKTRKKGPPWNFGILNIDLEDINFGYSNSSDGFTLETILAEGKIRADEMDMRNKTIDLRRISLARSTTILHTGDQPKKQKAPAAIAQNKFPWNISSKVIDLDDVSIVMGKGDINVKDSAVNNFSVSGLDMKLKELLLDKEHAAVDIKSLGFALDNGFIVKEMQGELHSDPGNSELNLSLETDHSKLSLKGSAEESFFGIVSNPHEIPKASISIRDTELALEDISYFISDLQEQTYFKALAANPYSLGGDIDIVKSTYSFSGISLSQDKNFKVSLDGSVESPFQSTRARADLNLDISGVDMNWLKRVLSSFGMEDGLQETHIAFLAKHY